MGSAPVLYPSDALSGHIGFCLCWFFCLEYSSFLFNSLLSSFSYESQALIPQGNFSDPPNSSHLTHCYSPILRLFFWKLNKPNIFPLHTSLSNTYFLLCNMAWQTIKERREGGKGEKERGREDGRRKGRNTAYIKMYVSGESKLVITGILRYLGIWWGECQNYLSMSEENTEEELSERKTV